MRIPEYFNGWFVNCWSFSKPRGWSFKKATEAESYLRREYGNTGICISAFKYASPAPDRDTEEYGHLFFDFDGKDELGPKQAREDAIKLIEFLTKTLDLDETELQVYFSGSKGYHVIVNASALGIKPMPFLRDVYKFLAHYIAHQLGLKSLDTSIYNWARLLRVINSQHNRSNLYKIWVPLSTLISRPHFYIESMAQKPGPKPPEFTFRVQPYPVAQAYYEDILTKYQKKLSERPVIQKFEIPDEAWESVVGLPTCIEDILERFMISGKRWEAQARLVTYFKATGVPEDEAFEVIADKVRENYPPREAESRLFKIRGAVERIYRTEGYNFSCSFVLGLTSMEQDPEQKVKCSGEQCPLFNTCGGASANPQTAAFGPKGFQSWKESTGSPS